jgi:hypothetical protein
MGKEKRGISEVIGYVLLVTLALSMAVLVYDWLKPNAALQDELGCPEGAEVIIKEISNNGTHINISIENRGRFTIDWVLVRVNNISNAKIGTFLVQRNTTALDPGEEEVLVIKKNPGIIDINDNLIGTVSGNLYYVEVQPIIYDTAKKKTRFCEKTSGKEI